MPAVYFGFINMAGFREFRTDVSTDLAGKRPEPGRKGWTNGRRGTGRLPVVTGHLRQLEQRLKRIMHHTHKYFIIGSARSRQQQ